MANNKLHIGQRVNYTLTGDNGEIVKFGKRGNAKVKFDNLKVNYMVNCEYLWPIVTDLTTATVAAHILWVRKELDDIEQSLYFAIYQDNIDLYNYERGRLNSIRAILSSNKK